MSSTHMHKGLQITLAKNEQRTESQCSTASKMWSPFQFIPFISHIAGRGKTLKHPSHAHSLFVAT